MRVQSSVEAGDAQNADARRSELDGQRDPIELPANFNHGSNVGVGKCVRLALGGCSLDEERYTREEKRIVGFKCRL
jgi:hypothetical protein